MWGLTRPSELTTEPQYKLVKGSTVESLATFKDYRAELLKQNFGLSTAGFGQSWVDLRFTTCRIQTRPGPLTIAELENTDIDTAEIPAR